MPRKYRLTLFACYCGFITQAISNNLAPLLFVVFRNEYSITFEMIGRLILFNFCTQIGADLLAARYVDRIGYRPAIVAAHICSTIGLAGLGIFPQVMPRPYAGLVIATLIYSIGGGLIEVLVSPIVESLPGEAKASAMSLLHSFYCWGQMLVVLISTVLLKAFGLGIWHILPLAWALVPLVNTFIFLKVPLMPPVPPHQKTPVRQLLRSGYFQIALLMMLCAGAAELTISQWSSLFAEKGLRVTKVWGDLLGPGLFAVFMGLGRTIFGITGHRLRLKNALLLCAMLCAGCYAAIALAPAPAVSLMAAAFCGFTVSLMWPGTYSLTAAASPQGGTAMFALLAVSGDIGCSIGPWLAGWISDLARQSAGLAEYGSRHGMDMEQLGMRAGLLTGLAFPLLMTACLLFWIRQDRVRLPELNAGNGPKL